MAPQIVIIGPKRREFASLLDLISKITAEQPATQFANIPGALESPSIIDEADLVLVLQSYSDEHKRAHVEMLIGQTLFGRLICCCGPWCESDGRTRDIWPEAIRVPARLAPALVEKELHLLAEGNASLPPTASRDEVFAHRLLSANELPDRDFSSVNAAIVGADRIFRRTIARHLAELGIRSISLPLIQTKPRQTITPKETDRGPIHLVINDLDPWSTMVEESIRLATQMFPTAEHWGIATMPDSGLATEISDCSLNRVIPKLDLELGLRWHLKEGIPAFASGTPQ